MGLFRPGGGAFSWLFQFIVEGQFLFVGVVLVQGRLGPDQVAPADVQVGQRSHVLLGQGEVPHVVVGDDPGSGRKSTF